MRHAPHFVAGLLIAVAVGLLAGAPTTNVPLWPLIGAAALVAVAGVKGGVACSVLFILVMFMPEHSQTRWGVRSAADLATFYNTRPVAALPVSVFDVVVAGVCLGWLARRGTQARGALAALTRSRLGAALLAAAAFVLLAAAIGFARGHEPYHVLRELRPPLYFMVLFLVSYDELSQMGRARQFATIAAIAGALHGIEGFVRFILGVGRWTLSGRLMIYFDFADSLALSFTLCLLATSWMRVRRLEPSRVVAVLVGATTMGFAFLFSFRRSFWLGLLGGGLFLLWNASWHERRQIVGLGLASAFGIVLLFGSVHAARAILKSADAETVAAQGRFVGERLASIADTRSEPANRFRLYDTFNTAAAVRDSWGLGMGYGSRYRVVWSDDQQRKFLEHVNRTSHNTYLYLAMKMGVAGLLAWVWLFWEVLRRPLGARHAGRQADIALAVGATLVTAAVAALFMPLAYNVRPMVLLALVGGLGAAVGDTRGQSA